MFDLVNNANGVKIVDSTRKRGTQDKLPKDEDGSQTVDYLKKVQRAVARITTTHPGSLGIHPIVYFYTRGGAFQPAAFIGASQLVESLIAQDKLGAFTTVRQRLEDFLVANKDFISKIVHKFGSGTRSSDWFFKVYSRIFEDFALGKDADQVVAEMRLDSDFAFLTVPSPRSQAGTSGKSFSRNVKTAAFFEEALPGGVRCSICRALVHKNSMHFDHLERKQDGGSNAMSNAAVSHPYCNSTFKN